MHGPRAGTSPLLLLAGLTVLAAPARAHAGGTSGAATTAALPAWILWAVGAGVVALSFALVGLFLTQRAPRDPGQADPVGPGHVTGLPRGLVTLGRVVGLLFWLGVIAPAIIPWNFGWAAPRLVWLGAWTALPVLAYLVGNVWMLISPFRALAGLADRMRGDNRRYAYPKRVGAWPSVILLAGLIGLEVTQLGQGSVALARLAIAYTAFTVLGMMLFGSRAWLTRVEVFDRVFAWWSTLAPLQLTREGLRASNPLERLGNRQARGAAGATFAIVLLYGVNFDGFLATGAGRSALASLSGLGGLGARAVLLVGGLVVFLAAFWGCVELVRRAAGSLRRRGRVGARVAVGLLPIAAGYHLAHAGPYLAEQLPLLWETLSDPLALGPTTATAWQIPASAGLALVAAQMVVIVAAHVLAVVAAHEVAFGAFASRVQAVKSEGPITALMVAYTFFGLWLAAAGVAALGGGP